MNKQLTKEKGLQNNLEDRSDQLEYILVELQSISDLYSIIEHRTESVWGLAQNYQAHRHNATSILASEVSKESASQLALTYTIGDKLLAQVKKLRELVG